MASRAVFASMVTLTFASSACAPEEVRSTAIDATHDRSPVRLTRVSSANADLDITYDATGTQLVQQAFTIHGSGLASTVDYTYANDHIVKEAFQGKNPDGTQNLITTTFDYDGNRLRRKTIDHNGEKKTIAYTYDGHGLLTNTDNGDGSTSTYSYDDSSRLVSIASRSSSWQFAYDTQGHLVNLKDGSGDDYTLSYDEKNRVKLVTSVAQRFDFAYDETGKLSTLKTKFAGPEVVFHYTYADGSFGNQSLRTGIDGNYELRNFIDLEGKAHTRPDPLQIDPDL